MKLLVAVLLNVKESVDRHETAIERDRNARRDSEDLVIIVFYIIRKICIYYQRKVSLETTCFLFGALLRS